MLRCKFGLPSVQAEEETKGRMPPIKVKFEVPYFTVSGIQVRKCECFTSNSSFERENIIIIVHRPSIFVNFCRFVI